MKEIGMEYQAIDACPNDHIIYYWQYALENELPQCEISRYRTNQVTKKCLAKFFVIFHNSTFPTTIQVPKYNIVYGLPWKE